MRTLGCVRQSHINRGEFSDGVLQAPPFSGRHVRVSTTRRDGQGGWIADHLAQSVLLCDRDQERGLAALKALRTHQIGGAFWAGGAAPRQPFTLLRPQTRAGAALMLRWNLKGVNASSLFVCAPNRPWARTLAARLSAAGIAIHLGEVDPWRVLEGVEAVDVEGEDPTALLALAAEVPVRCCAPSDISGWGLTVDALNVPRRGSRTLAQAAYAYLIGGVDYHDPFDDRPSDCESVIQLLADWRTLVDRNQLIGCCTGMAAWKRKAVSALLHTGQGAPLFRAEGRAAVALARRRDAGVAVWASRAPRGLADAAQAASVPIYHVEDGFLRSAGLGSNLTPPCSIVIDASGPHFGVEVPSDLETLLSETSFSPDLIARAERLIATLVRLGLTKYNIKGSDTSVLHGGRRRVLVAGQVEDDLSVRLGGAGVKGNLDLLARTRAAEPDALIVFKPHPDVEAGHRRGVLSNSEALRYADLIVRRGSIANLLSQVDAVHVLTSLTGFEALLRGREVVTHGHPFYAGWGLTRDLAPPPRRGRRLSLAELVAGALILYPIYLDPISRLPCQPELLAARLALGAKRSSPIVWARRLQGRIRGVHARVGDEISA